MKFGKSRKFKSEIQKILKIGKIYEILKICLFIDEIQRISKIRLKLDKSPKFKEFTKTADFTEI